MKSKWPTSIVVVLDKMYTFLVPSVRKNFLKTTEHIWAKTILSRGCRGKCLMNAHFDIQ